MQCKMLVVSSELEERSDMRESREIEVVIWVLEKCSMKVVSGGMAELHFVYSDRARARVLAGDIKSPETALFLRRGFAGQRKNHSQWQ